MLALPTLLQFIHMCMKCADITSQNGQESHYLKNSNLQIQKSRDFETKNRDLPKFSKFRKIFHNYVDWYGIDLDLPMTS